MLAVYACFLWLYALLALANPLKARGTAAQNPFLVTKLPGMHENVPIDDLPLMFAGQLELFPENQTSYFFWKYSDIHKLPEAEKRTIFWLNGGPGCSSMDGALMEAGPFRINDDHEIVYNNGSWHKLGDMVFVDQPGGTGFSFTDKYDHELDLVTAHFLRFMEKYFELFPEDRENEIYFAGESYAGQYIPYIANGILRHNKNLREGEIPYDLKGLLIGNGWIAPNEQSLYYMPYCVQAGIIKPDNPQWGRILQQQEMCQKIVDANSGSESVAEVESSTCESVLTMILSATQDSRNPDQACYNMYDYTLKDSYPSCGMNWPPDLVNVGPFLNDPVVKMDLNLVRAKKWEECSSRVHRALSAKNSAPAITLFPALLEELPIILFNGNRDIICNYMGTEGFINTLTWGGATGFSGDVDVLDWVHDANVAGYIKTERNLTFINVFDASHMVPFDKPDVSRALMDIITGNFDTTDDNDAGQKRQLVTYPLGERQKKISDSEPATPVESPQETPLPSNTIPEEEEGAPQPTSSKESASSSDAPEDTHTGRITRLIQLAVIIILIWGVCVLYSLYRSRPSSIIKTGPSGKKKNVQWADQLRQFEEEDQQFQRLKNQGIFSKAMNKLTGASTEPRYDPVAEDIELGDNIPVDHPDNFIIESDDEDERPRSET